jgi:hypothetical protein
MFARKPRRLLSCLRRNLSLIVLLLIIILTCAVFHQEIIYAVYIRTVNLEPYKRAVTLWATDYHIRYDSQFLKRGDHRTSS